MRRTVLRAMLALITGLLLAGCSSVEVERDATLPAGRGWALLPIVNHSQAPRAGERVEALVETALHVRGLDPVHYPADSDHTGMLIPDEEQRFRKALSWARREGLRFGVTGTVEEWRYKSGLDGEPAVGISLRVIDIPTGRVLWAASGARSGWGYESASGTAGKLVRQLLKGLKLTRATAD